MVDGVRHFTMLRNDLFSADISFCVLLSNIVKIHHKPIRSIYSPRTFIFNVSPSKVGGVFLSHFSTRSWHNPHFPISSCLVAALSSQKKPVKDKENRK